MLTDCHAHTSRSYCAEESMCPELYVQALEKSQDIDKVIITDHTMAIYFPREVAWSWRYMTDSSVFDSHREAGNARFAAHLDMLGKFAAKGIVKGLETEMMHDGRFDFDPDFRKDFDVLIGSVHWLPVNKDNCGDPEMIVRHWLAHSLVLVNSGIDIIGHPFRWLANQVNQVDPALIKMIVAHAKAAGVAVELNSHYKIDTDAEMLREIVAQGATLALGTDSHRPDEILDISYHKSLLKSLDIKESSLKLFKR